MTESLQDRLRLTPARISGMANAACAAIDSMTIDSVLGTIAGDDTIFVLCRTEDAAMTFTNKMRAMLNA